MVSPQVVEKLELRLKQLKVSIIFCQVDGIVAGDGANHFITEPVKMRMGKHKLSFIVAQSCLDCLGFRNGTLM